MAVVAVVVGETVCCSAFAAFPHVRFIRISFSALVADVAVPVLIEVSAAGACPSVFVQDSCHASVVLRYHWGGYGPDGFCVPVELGPRYFEAGRPESLNLAQIFAPAILHGGHRIPPSMHST